MFAHGGEVESPIYDPDAPVADDEDQYDHLHGKILDLPERMYTTAGSRVADERAAFVREYVAQFDAELGGER